MEKTDAKCKKQVWLYGQLQFNTKQLKRKASDVGIRTLHVFGFSYLVFSFLLDYINEVMRSKNEKRLQAYLHILIECWCF